MTNTDSPEVLYFGYGSNMWRDQMLLRCPKSHFAGIGRLANYEWIINDRGYANVVASSSSNDHVWGLIYTLTTSDEQALDRNEGVPAVYEKKMKSVEFWAGDISERTHVGTAAGVTKEMLVYIDCERTEPSEPKEEYIYRMNQGIEDAVAAGVPLHYVKDVLRKYIPEAGQHNAAMKDLAQKQAQNFEDE